MSHTHNSTFVAIPEGSSKELEASPLEDGMSFVIKDRKEGAKAIVLEQDDAVAMARYVLNHYGLSAVESNGSNGYFRSGPGGP